MKQGIKLDTKSDTEERRKRRIARKEKGMGKLQKNSDLGRITRYLMPGNDLSYLMILR